MRKVRYNNRQVGIGFLSIIFGLLCVVAIVVPTSDKFKRKAWLPQEFSSVFLMLFGVGAFAFGFYQIGQGADRTVSFRFDREGVSVPGSQKQFAKWSDVVAIKSLGVRGPYGWLVETHDGIVVRCEYTGTDFNEQEWWACIDEVRSDLVPADWAKRLDTWKAAGGSSAAYENDVAVVPSGPQPTAAGEALLRLIKRGRG